MSEWILVDGNVPEVALQGENKRRPYGFPIGHLIAEHPGGLATLMIQRKGETETYPSQTTEMQGDVLVWEPTAYDTANAGAMKVQVVYAAGEVIAKDRVLYLSIGQSLTFSETPPPDWDDWVGDLLGAASNVHAEIEAAEETLDGKIRDATETIDGKIGTATETLDGKIDAAENVLDAKIEAANAEALKAEGYASGTQNGTPVSSGPYFENNGEFYLGQTRNAAETAGANAEEAKRNALTAEGLTLGKQNGVPVPPLTPYYNNNAAYYADRSQLFAESAAGDAYEARRAQSGATSEADRSRQWGLASEGYAVGKQNGEVVSSGPYYENNAKYYADLAREIISVISAEAVSVGSGQSVYAEMDYSGSHPVLRIGLQKGDKGDTGSSGVYYGTTEPTDPNVNVWIDPTGVSDVEMASGVSF